MSKFVFTQQAINEIKQRQNEIGTVGDSLYKKLCVLELWSKGCSDKAIAKATDISRATITRIKSAYKNEA